MKDPAVLWYFNDWMGGTATLTRHQKGCYIDLLCVQFNSGPLSLDEIKTVLGSDFGSSWPALQKKFKSENGLYFNERLAMEKYRRNTYTSSRRKNASSKHMLQHMEDVNENITVNIIKNTYGEFQNVFLTEEEFIKLSEYCGSENNLKLLIVELSSYIKSKGKDPYRDHYATLQGWWRRKAQQHVETNKPKRTIA